MEPKVNVIIITIPNTIANRPGIDHRIIDKTNPINILKNSFINTIIWWASTCLFPSFAREINIHPSINKKRDKKLVKTGEVPQGQGYDAIHQKINPKAINMLPTSNAPPGFINGFNSSPVLD